MDKENPEKLLKIIPESKPETSKFLKILLGLMAIIFLATVGGYFWLRAESAKLEKEKQQLTAEFIQAQRQKASPKSIRQFSQKVRIFSFLIDEHKKPSMVIEYLKSITHPKVKFNFLDIDAKTGEVILNGVADSFRAIGEQILVFSLQENIQNLKVASISLNRKGNVDFSLTFTLSNEVFNSSVQKDEQN